MKNYLSLGALVLALGLIVYLYFRLATTEQQLAAAERRATDCEQVTFQLQNQLTQALRKQQEAE